LILFYLILSIIFRDLIFPNDNKINDFIVFTKSLLNKKVNERICSFSKLKLNSFLQNFNWDDLVDLKIKPSYIPEIEDYSKKINNFTKDFETQINVKN
jgi:ribosomal protein L21E